MSVPGPAVLIVDDTPSKLTAVEAVLEGLPCRIVRAGSGAEALHRCLEQDFAVILLDVQMPVMDGFETATLIRQRGLSEHTPIIFITSMNKSEMDALKGYGSGAVDYIVTPIIPEILRVKIGLFIDLYRRSEQVRQQARELEAANAALKKHLEEKVQLIESLESANKELEQFAYIASHDLQEPLRMVSSYTQLLGQKYEGQLDEKAKKYIDYAVDGAVRMQRLINDLLAYSRVGSRGKKPEPVDAHSMLGEAIRNLSATIEETRSVITNDDLPVISADGSQIMLVFQNLIANSIKFRREEIARIHVTANDRGREWVFSVADNGIGIDMQYAERVFIIFQRLHTREEYPGTGIGLAVCKRIVEHHGGKIWLESEIGKGTTFFFSIPKNEGTTV